MKAFISYSVHPSELIFISFLAEELRRNHRAEIISSAGNSGLVASFDTFKAVTTSDILIGIITEEEISSSTKTEVGIAVQQHIPYLLLIERGIRWRPVGRHKENIIAFDRGNMGAAIEWALQKSNEAGSQAAVVRSNNLSTDNSALAWILGGAAVLALLYAMRNE